MSFLFLSFTLFYNAPEWNSEVSSVKVVENIEFGYNLKFWTVRDRDCIFGIHLHQGQLFCVLDHDLYTKMAVFGLCFRICLSQTHLDLMAAVVCNLIYFKGICTLLVFCFRVCLCISRSTRLRIPKTPTRHTAATVRSKSSVIRYCIHCVNGHHWNRSTVRFQQGWNYWTFAKWENKTKIE